MKKESHKRIFATITNVQFHIRCVSASVSIMNSNSFKMNDFLCGSCRCHRCFCHCWRVCEVPMKYRHNFDASCLFPSIDLFTILNAVFVFSCFAVCSVHIQRNVTCYCCSHDFRAFSKHLHCCFLQFWCRYHRLLLLKLLSIHLL